MKKFVIAAACFAALSAFGTSGASAQMADRQQQMGTSMDSNARMMHRRHHMKRHKMMHHRRHMHKRRMGM